MCDNNITKLTTFVTRTWKVSTTILECSQININNINENVLDPLTKLRNINISRNDLPHLGEIFKKNYELESIDCSRNQIAYINGSWSHLEKLIYIDLSRNNLISFRYEIFGKFLNYQTARNLYVNGNPFVCNYNLKWLISLNNSIVNESTWKADVMHSCSNATIEHSLESIENGILFLHTTFYIKS